MKAISWNINGIRSAWDKGLPGIFAEDADIYAFQEIRTNEPFEQINSKGYFSYWSFCGRKGGYSGTMCLSKTKQLAVAYDMTTFVDIAAYPSENEALGFDYEGRIISLEFEEFFFINVYVPNSQGGLLRLEYRKKWDELLTIYLATLRRIKPVIICGDFNVPISDADVFPGNAWIEVNANGLYQTAEREALQNILNMGYLDTYRYKHPDGTAYTWWSTRLHKRLEDKGWRLDYFIVSDDLQEKLNESYMLSQVQGSDHCPICLDIAIDLAALSPHPKRPKGKPYTYYYHEPYATSELTLALRRADLGCFWDNTDWEATRE